MAQTGSYRDELENELKQTDPSSHASRLLTQEIERLSNGEDEKKEVNSTSLMDLHTDKPQKFSMKIRIPVREHPRYNFVGKLLGPKGSTLKALQEQSGCKMAIMGRGSMREKDKEEELRKEGGKYSHLSEDLHVNVECFTEMSDGYQRLAAAFGELKKFLIPLQEEMYEGGDMGMNGSHRGRGGFRGGPPERGGRGGFRGRGNGPAPPPVGRGALTGRGGPPSRGAPPRGAPAGRGAPLTRGGGNGGRGGGPSVSYDSGYNSQAYNSGYGSNYESGYDESYGQNYSSGADSQYYDYGHGTSATGYDSYSGGYDYGSESWGNGGAKTSAQTRGGSTQRGQARSHPYTRPSAGSTSY